jgi:phenylalanyl-tRNA synthetase beta chain
MPTVSVDKEDLWERLEQRFCRQCHSRFAILWTQYSRATASEEFDKLCFEFGIELDEDVSAVYFSRFTPSTRRHTWA